MHAYDPCENNNVTNLTTNSQGKPCNSQSTACATLNAVKQPVKILQSLVFNSCMLKLKINADYTQTYPLKSSSFDFNEYKLVLRFVSGQFCAYVSNFAIEQVKGNHKLYLSLVVNFYKGLLQ